MFLKCQKLQNKNISWPINLCLKCFVAPTKTLRPSFYILNVWSLRSSLIDLNPVTLKCYLFVISLDKSNGSCNVLSPNICVPKKTKDINVKVFNVITNENEANTMAKCDFKFHVISNANSIIQQVIQIKNGIIKHVYVNVNIIVKAEKIIFGILAHVFLVFCNMFSGGIEKCCRILKSIEKNGSLDTKWANYLFLFRSLCRFLK